MNGVRSQFAFSESSSILTLHMQLYLQFGQLLFRQDSALIGALLVRSQWIIGLNQVDCSDVTMRLLFSACLLFTNVLHPLQPVVKSWIPQLAG